jgi:hypothetical protein
VHLGPRGYHSQDLRAGRGALNAIEEAELGRVGGLRILHLQRHLGRDSLCLAQRGATDVRAVPHLETIQRSTAEHPTRCALYEGESKSRNLAPGVHRTGSDLLGR